MALRREEKRSLVYVGVLWLVAMGFLVLWSVTTWPTCDERHDGNFFASRGGYVQQCRCDRVAGAWHCGMVDR